MTVKKQEQKKAKVVKGEVETLTHEQQKVIDDTVKLVNERWNSSCRNLIEIGAHLLKNFYNDDPELAKAKGRKKDRISLRKLAIRPDLDVSIATLSRAFNLAVQDKLLTKVESPKLTASHKILLLHIDDPKEKVTYAKTITSNAMSCRAFTKLLIKDGFVQPRGLASSNRQQLTPKIQSSYDIFIEPLESIINFEIDDFDFSKLTEPNSQDFVESVKKAKVVIDKLFSVITKAAP